MIKTLIVVDNEFSGSVLHLETITFAEYLAEYPKFNEPHVRVINLCNTEGYLGAGYYCSLLAEARGHKVLPSVNTLSDLRMQAENQSSLFTLQKRQSKSTIADGITETFYIWFGWTPEEKWKSVGSQIFSRYPAPILEVVAKKSYQTECFQIKARSIADLKPEDLTLFDGRLQGYLKGFWRRPKYEKVQRWEMAILLNPEEKFSPSNDGAIKRIIKAAGKLGISAEVITEKESAKLPQFDALFIRETTTIEHHTFRLAKKAEQEGLVVIDDPTSILRCCNKVFLHDAFTYNKVPALKTKIVMGASDKDIHMLEAHFEYPMVLKLPESSFSKGVYKVDNRKELQQYLQNILKETMIALVQEFLFTDFDWRIGVLNGKAIFACQYFMAKNHWKIFNHQAKRYISGKFETLPTFEVPKMVLDAALNASKVVGKGLYGVDVKQQGKEAFVIEVNDSPNIDHGVEDAYLGDELYMVILNEFSKRLDARGR